MKVFIKQLFHFFLHKCLIFLKSGEGENLEMQFIKPSRESIANSDLFSPSPE